MKLERSIAAFARARAVIAGGVNSPVRALGAVGLSPVFMKSGSGAMLYDLDGHEYLDYVMSWGALLLGHAHPAVTRAIANAAMRGTSFGTPTELESELAELIVSMMPSIERLRFVSSGTEATMSAIAAGARIHRALQDREVRRLLSRARRRVSDRRRLGRADARHARLARRHRRHGARHDRVAVQRRVGDRARVRGQSPARSPP